MVPSGDGGVDLSKVTAVCKQILCEANSQQLTGRELRQRIAKGIGVDEALLATDTIQQHVDAIVLEHFAAGTHPEQPCPIDETPKRMNDRKDKGKPRPKKAKTVAGESGGPPSSPSRGGNACRADPSSSSLSKGSTSSSGKAGEKIDRLKSYINRCGVRKLWKRELDGLSERQQIVRLEGILHHELGMEGRPTLEKCKIIKERREFEEELRALDPKNVLPTRLRSQRGQPYPSRDHGSGIEREDNGPDDDYNGNRDDTSRQSMRPQLDLSAFGDPDDDDD